MVVHGPAELVLGLLIAVAALVTIARHLEIAYPIFLVIGGLILGLVPGVPRIQVDPELIFLVVLPPLLYIAAFYTPIQNLRANLGTISSLAIGLIIVSAGAVAAAAHALVPGITWAAAVALGAIVAPPDAIAATAVTRRLAVPRQIVTILEGESLLNDATALTIYSIALVVAAGGVFSPSEAIVRFTGAILGGVAIGVAVGWLIAHIRARIEDTPVEITISLLTPYAAFLPADRLDASGVIATVAAGLFLGHRGSRIMGADARLTGRAVWETITFLLNGFVFIVMGLEIPLLLRGALTLDQAIRLIGIGVAATVLLVLVRAVWILATVFLPQRIHGRREALEYSLVLSWAGMRGVVSLAAVLALPLTEPAGQPFPAREALVIVTLTVIVLTLVGQGLTLPAVIRSLRLSTDSGLRAEEARARQHLVDAAMRRLDELYPVWPGHRPLLDQLRETYRHRSEHVERQRDAAESGGEDQELIEHREIQRTIIDAEREVLLRLRAESEISDEVLRELERELDLEERRMDA
jgi:monovalent cation/hydrogen antiporter